MKFEGMRNLFDVLMKDAILVDVGFIDT